MGRYPPRIMITGKIKFREFVHYLYVGHTSLLRNLVSECDAIIIGTNVNDEARRGLLGVTQDYFHRIVVVADCCDLAPWLSPSFIDGPMLYILDRKGAIKKIIFVERKSQL